jgi:hypothetical protein
MIKLRIGIVMLGSAVAGACAWSPPGMIGLSAAEVDQFEQITARRVRRCYHTPQVTSSARRIATRLRVRYGPDGSLLGLPILLSQSGVTEWNQAYAGQMAEAARTAVIRCAPVHIPPALAHFPVNEIDLLFSPLLHG